MQQFPGERQQGGGGLARGLDLGLRGPGLQGRIDQDREAPPRLGGDAGPGGQDVGGLQGRQGDLVKEPAPVGQVLPNPERARLEDGARPDGVLLQIPAQFLGLDRAQGGDQAPGLRTLDRALAGRGRFIDQPGAGTGAAQTVGLVEAQVGQFQDQFLQGRVRRRRRRGPVGRQAPAERDQDGVQRRLDPAGCAAERAVERCLAEQVLQREQSGAVQ